MKKETISVCTMYLLHVFCVSFSTVFALFWLLLSQEQLKTKQIQLKIVTNKDI